MGWRELEGMTWFGILKESDWRSQEHRNAYARLYRILRRPPSKSELKEEMLNPTNRSKNFGREPWNKGKKIEQSVVGAFPKGSLNREYREKIKQRPRKYNFVMSVIDFLKRQNKTIDRPNIIDEMGLSERTLTPDDNEAIDFVLQEMNK